MSAARRATGATFTPLGDGSPPQFVSDAFGATAAAADGGRAVVSWASATNPSAAQPPGVFATTADGGGAFGAPEQLADAQTLHGAATDRRSDLADADADGVGGPPGAQSRGFARPAGHLVGLRNRQNR